MSLTRGEQIRMLGWTVPWAPEASSPPCPRRRCGLYRPAERAVLVEGQLVITADAEAVDGIGRLEPSMSRMGIDQNAARSSLSFPKRSA
ncbi:hypothetical protein [Kaistia nematophila]|uniref:Uncharacterized protein n=1 Tax=Kaistia nematophila TaxID=2994654 RepID=A0A9X3E527_9HYPH|nr:hypothetical protein [Kaistia nematophila]MCX5571351.1 hypothetical protein [Kaistia nematophila]